MKVRSLISGLSSVGMVETGYLTYSKLSSAPIFAGPFCVTNDLGESSCNAVISSPFSSLPTPIADIPLSAIAFVSYATIAFLAISQVIPAVRNEKIAYSENGNSLSEQAAQIILFLSTSMATFSGYLMLILFSVIRQPCAYCYLSAFLSVSIAAIAWRADIVANRTKAFVISLSSISVTALASVFLFFATTSFANSPALASTAPAAQILQSMQQEQEKEDKVGRRPPQITDHSTARSLAVAERLKAANARMFGAYWCSHCFNQKQTLGSEAYEKGLVDYIECSKDGFQSQAALCKLRDVPGYPTWEIDGQLFPGEKSVEELEKLLASKGY